MESGETLRPCRDQAIAVEIEGIDLDLCASGRHGRSRCRGSSTMASISRWAVARHHHQQGLRRRDHAADRVHRELLHRAVDRRGENLQAGRCCALSRSSLKARRPCARPRPVRRRACAGTPLRSAHACWSIAASAAVGLVQWLFWTSSSCCCLDQRLQQFQIIGLGTGGDGHTAFCGCRPLLGDRQQWPPASRWWPRIVSRSASFCCALTVEHRDLGPLLGGLVEQERAAAWRPGRRLHRLAA